MKKKEDLRIIKTKKALYNAIISLLEEKNFEKIKISEICKISKINRSTFYDHFTDKYELLNEVIKDLQSQLNESLDKVKDYKNVKEYYLLISKKIINYLNNNLESYKNIIKYNSNSIAFDMIEKAFKENVEIICKTIHKDDLIVDTKIIANFYVPAITSLIREHFISNDNLTDEELLKNIEILIIEPTKK